MWYRSNHFCVHTASADASGNRDHVTEWPKINLLGYNHDRSVAIPWLWGSAWMLCNNAHVLCWNLLIAVNSQEELWILLQSRLGCKNPYVKMRNVRGWAAWPGLPIDIILLSGAVAALIKKAIIISPWFAGPSALFRNLYIAHRYHPSTIPAQGLALLPCFLSDSPLPDAKDNSERHTELRRVCLVPGRFNRSSRCLPAQGYVWCGVSFSQTQLNSDGVKAEVWFLTLFCYLCLVKMQHLPTLLFGIYSLLFIVTPAYASL